MLKRALSLFALFFSVGICFAQDQFAEKYRFLKHLESIEAYSEGLLYIHQWDLKDMSEQRVDSLNYSLGRFSYLLKDREQAVKYFDKVSLNQKELFNKSRFYAGLESAYLNRLSSSYNYFQSVDAQNEQDKELQLFELKALALLNRDFVQYKSYKVDSEQSSFHLKDHSAILEESYQVLLNHKSKSPVLAGFMSAVIPGSGKIYNGQFGQGIMTLVTASIFGLQAYEGFRKNGLNSAPFITFGSLFTLFHISNIYGSIVAVRLGERNFNNNQDESILLRMHIPIRVLYN